MLYIVIKKGLRITKSSSSSCGKSLSFVCANILPLERCEQCDRPTYACISERAAAFLNEKLLSCAQPTLKAVNHAAT